MIKEKRYQHIDLDKKVKICGGIYTNENGERIISSRYVIPLSWIEIQLIKLKKWIKNV